MSFATNLTPGEKVAAIPGLITLIKQNAVFLYGHNDFTIATYKLKPRDGGAMINVLCGVDGTCTNAVLLSKHDLSVSLSSNVADSEFTALRTLLRKLEERVATKLAEDHRMGPGNEWVVVKADDYGLGN